MNMTERYRRWFEYEKDAHLKVLASLDRVPEPGKSDAAFQKAVDLFAHIVAARMMWLHRFGATVETPKEMFPKGVGLNELQSRVDRMHNAWSNYLAGLEDCDLERVFEYNAFEGPLYRSVVEDILTQLFGHSLYHRGQIAALVRSLDGEPAVTDFVFWTRESLP